MGTTALVTNTYAANNGNLTKSVYGNGSTIEYVYDDLDRVVEEKIDGTTAYKWTYDNNGSLHSLTDCLNGISYSYEYDLTGRLIRSYSTKGSIKLLSTTAQA